MPPRHAPAPQLAEVLPLEGSGCTLPLDLFRIAARCRAAYFARRRFAAVQLAYRVPRARVLIFRESPFAECLRAAHRFVTTAATTAAHSVSCVSDVRFVASCLHRHGPHRRHRRGCCRGREYSVLSTRVCTVAGMYACRAGTSGTLAARLALALAQRQLAEEAGVHLRVRNVNIINIVAAVDLCTDIDCEAFAETHSSESHFDRDSFVGLAVRTTDADARPHTRTCAHACICAFAWPAHAASPLSLAVASSPRIRVLRGVFNGPCQVRLIVCDNVCALAVHGVC